MDNLIKLYKEEYKRTKKSLGQHFLTNKAHIDKIADTASKSDINKMVEIGPGCGAITQALLERDNKVVAIELDTAAFDFITKHLSIYKDFKAILSDVCLVELDQIYDGDKFTVIGNLPYNVSVKILTHITQYIESIDSCVFMFQKEVAQRIRATSGSKIYSSLSVFCNYHYEIEKVISLSGANFWPNTKVYSEVLQLKPREKRLLPIEDEEAFFIMIRKCFTQKRKTLKNNLSSSIGNIEEILNSIGIQPSIRAEELSIEAFVQIYKASCKEI